MIIYIVWTYTDLGQTIRHSSYLNRAAAEMVVKALRVEGIYKNVWIEEVYDPEDAV